MSLRLRPCTLREANALVARWHRHHRPVQGQRFSIGLAAGEGLLAAAVVGRPVARGLDDGWTAEVTRLVVAPQADPLWNCCSRLYGACWRAWKAMGGRRMVTYILASEPGTSLRAAGWRPLHQVPGKSWDTPARPRLEGLPGRERFSTAELAQGRLFAFDRVEQVPKAAWGVP